MESEEIQNHLAAGKQVTKLALAYEDKFSFLLDDKLTIRRIRFKKPEGGICIVKWPFVFNPG